jgi:alpha-1,2-mannosyltransferase
MTDVAVANPPRTLDRGRRLWSTTAWAGAVVVLVVLLLVRYRAGVAQAGNDFLVYRTAAEAVVRGEDSWTSEGYVYSPLVALLMVSPASSGGALQLWTAVSPFAAVSSVTLLYSWPVTVEPFFGNSDLLVLAAIALAGLAARRRNLVSGAFHGLAGLIKTWPLGTVPWLFRRGATHRLRSLVGVICGGLVAVIGTLALWGTEGLARWARATVMYTDQNIVSYSVWGFPRSVFGTVGDFPPIVESPALGAMSGLVLGLGVLALLAVSLARLGTATLSLWNVTSCVILPLPVSRYAYRILILPLLWAWAADFLARPSRKLVDYLTIAAFGLWWVLDFRIIWPGGPGGTSSSAAFLVMMAATFAVVALSVLRAVRLDARRPPRERVEAPS